YRAPHEARIDAWVAELTRRYARDEAFREAQRRGIPAALARSAAELPGDPQLAERGFFTEVEHAGRGRLRMPGAPFRASATPWRRPAPGRPLPPGSLSRPLSLGERARVRAHPRLPAP